MFDQLFSIMLEESASGRGIPWWVWVILIVILLVLLWFWFGREADETPASAETSEEPDVPVAQKVETIQVDETPAEPDDLKKIEGIGPKVSSLLNQAGIFTFQQMVDTGAQKLESILDEAGLQMINADTWPEQAKLAAAGEWDALDVLQDELKGGRRA